MYTANHVTHDDQEASFADLQIAGTWSDPSRSTVIIENANSLFRDSCFGDQREIAYK